MTTRNSKRRPSHPGALLREIVLPDTTLTQTELALQMGVSRLTVSEIIHEKRAELIRVNNRIPISTSDAPAIGSLETPC